MIAPSLIRDFDSTSLATIRRFAIVYTARGIERGPPRSGFFLPGRQITVYVQHAEINCCSVWDEFSLDKNVGDLGMACWMIIAVV